jgi:conjugal transfer/entry exclusion protein
MDMHKRLKRTGQSYYRMKRSEEDVRSLKRSKYQGTDGGHCKGQKRMENDIPSSRL